VGHLNNLFVPRGGNLNKPIFKSSNAQGVARGGMLKLQFDWYITVREEPLGAVFNKYCIFVLSGIVLNPNRKARGHKLGVGVVILLVASCYTNHSEALALMSLISIQEIGHNTFPLHL